MVCVLGAERQWVGEAGGLVWRAGGALPSASSPASQLRIPTAPSHYPAAPSRATLPPPAGTHLVQLLLSGDRADALAALLLHKQEARVAW